MSFDNRTLTTTARQAALGQLGQLVSDWARLSVTCDGATVTVVEGDHFVYVGASGAATSYLGRRFAIEESFTGEVLATGRSQVFTVDKAKRDATRQRAAKNQVAQGMVVAATVGGRPAGSVGVVSNSDEPAYGDIELRRLEGLGRFWARGVALLESHKWQRAPEGIHLDNPHLNAARSRLGRTIQSLQLEPADVAAEPLMAELIGIASLLRRVGEPDLR